MTPIIATLFDQLRVIGPLAGLYIRTSEMSDSDARSVIDIERHRLLPLDLLLNILADTSSRALPSTGVPYLYIRHADWPVDAPIGGYLDEAPMLFHRHILRSRIGGWSLQLQSFDDAALRIARCLLFIAATRGEAAAIDFAIDLVDAGAVFNSYALGFAILLLLQAVAGYGAAKAWRIFARHRPKTPQQWMDLHFSVFNGFYGYKPCWSDDFLDRLGGYMVRIFNACTRFRAAGTSDDWLLGQCRIETLAGSVHELVHHWHVPMGLELRGLYDEIEEFYADAGAINNQHVAEFMDYGASPLAVRFSNFASAFVDCFVRAGDPVPRETILDRRIMVPARFADEWRPTDANAEPLERIIDCVQPGWRNLSPKVAPIYATHVLGAPSSIETYRSYATVDGYQTSRGSRESCYSHRFGIAALDELIAYHLQGDFAAINALLAGVTPSDWAIEPVLRATLRGFCLSHSGDHLESIDAGKVIALCHMHDVNWLDLVRATHEAHLDRNVAAHAPALKLAERSVAEHLPGAIGAVEDLLGRFPYMVQLHELKADALAGEGDHDGAWDAITAALLIDPKSGDLWSHALRLAKACNRDVDCEACLLMSELFSVGRGQASEPATLVHQPALWSVGGAPAYRISVTFNGRAGNDEHGLTSANDDQAK